MTRTKFTHDRPHAPLSQAKPALSRVPGAHRRAWPTALWVTSALATALVTVDCTPRRSAQTATSSAEAPAGTSTAVAATTAAPGSTAGPATATPGTTSPLPAPTFAPPTTGSPTTTTTTRPAPTVAPMPTVTAGPAPTITPMPTTTARPAPTATASPAPTATTTSPPPIASTPLLAPLSGDAAKRLEVKMVLDELVAALDEADRAKVASIPLSVDPDPSDVNAFAGCDDGGHPFMAVTAGFMDAVEGIAQTRATDEIAPASKAYDRYLAAVIPELLKPKGTARLPNGIIPASVWGDARRQSRAREIFGDVVAFTLGHELAHHYLGHTGCANGNRAGRTVSPEVIGRIATQVIPVLNQPVELAADNAGCYNTLYAGKARRPRFRWSEQGGLILFDFFGRLEAAAGGSSSILSAIGFLRTHPSQQLRIPFVQAAARDWYRRNPM